MNHDPRNSKPMKKAAGKAEAAHHSSVRRGQAPRTRKPGSKKAGRKLSTPINV